MREGAFAGRVVVVTGGGGGIGAALGSAFVAAGARVALLDRDARALSRAAEALPAEHVLTVELDVRDAGACGDAIAEVERRWGGVDVLVNNAGISHRSLFSETDPEVLRRVMDVNFFGAVHCTAAALPSLEAREGRIVVISSVAGFAPLVGRTGYCASKHALHGFFGALRTELEPRGVGVTIVCPSFIATAIERSALRGDGAPVGDGPRAVSGSVMQPEELAARIVRAVARRRRLLTPSAVSRASLWLSRLAPRLYDLLMLRRQGPELLAGRRRGRRGHPSGHGRGVHTSP